MNEKHFSFLTQKIQLLFQLKILRAVALQQKQPETYILDRIFSVLRTTRHGPASKIRSDMFDVLFFLNYPEEEIDPDLLKRVSAFLLYLFLRSAQPDWLQTIKNLIFFRKNAKIKKENS